MEIVRDAQTCMTPKRILLFWIKKATSEIQRFLLRSRGASAASYLPATSASFLTAVPQGPSRDSSPTVAGTLHTPVKKNICSLIEVQI